jgi:hypothetical protein
MGFAKALMVLSVLLLSSVTASAVPDCGKGFKFDGGWNSCGCCIPESCPPPMGYTYTKSACRCPDERWSACFDDVAKKYTVCVPPGSTCPEKYLNDPGYDKACTQQRGICLAKCADPKAIVACQDACPTQDSCKKAQTQTQTQGEDSSVIPANLPFKVGGDGVNHPRIRHPVVGLAEPPKTPCAGGWTLLDTQYRMEQRRNCTKSYSELHQEKKKELGTIKYIFWTIISLPREIFEHDPCFEYDEQCEYTAAHTWQCPSNNAIVNWDQTKIVSAAANGGCHTYA